MRVIIQRVSQASVTIQGQVKSKINRGLMVLLGIESADSQQDIDWLVNKISNLRIFDDSEGRMNLSLKDTGADVLLVSQFTLHALVKKGNRPSYIKAAHPDIAIPLYEKFISKTEEILKKKIFTGEFGAMMQIALINDGPVTIFIDSKSKA